MVPFRAGDWKCGSDGCGYHNFAKNVSCLRCGASRAGAAVVADTGFASPLDAQSSYSGPPSAGLGGPMGGPLMSGMPSPGFPGHHFSSSQSGFGVGSLGGSGSYTPLSSNSMGPQDGHMNPALFDRRQDYYSPGTPGSGNGPLYAGLPGDEAFSFLAGSLGGLGLSDEPRHKMMNGLPNRSPAI